MKINLENRPVYSIIKSKMKNNFIKIKGKKPVFVCQVTESHLKVIKCLFSKNAKRGFVGLEAEVIPVDIDDKGLTARLIQIFKKLEYNHTPVIISLPRSKVVCRYLRVPTQIPKEIEKIVLLQAPRYLPYPADELIIGYQVLSTDREGYSDLNLVIVHKDVVERYVRIFKELRIAPFSIVLSSYGLVNFYNYLKPEESKVVMIIDIEPTQAELVIASPKKLLFSRYFKIDRSQTHWENLFINEINNSRDVYLKEVPKDAPHKIAVISAGKTYQGLVELLNKRAGLSVDVLSYDKINLSGSLLNSILTSDTSFASIVGLGLKETEESLNLLPVSIKEQTRRLTQHKEWLRLFLFISGIILMLGLGIVKNLDNKTLYLKQLKIELDKLAKDAKPLEEIEKRFKAVGGRLQKEPLSLEVFYELHRIIPNQISLINLNYEEDNQVTLRGQTPELNSVFIFVSQLEKSAVFKNFNIKVRYATKKRIQAGEVIDFEIACIKK